MGRETLRRELQLPEALRRKLQLPDALRRELQWRGQALRRELQWREEVQMGHTPRRTVEVTEIVRREVD